MKTFNSFLFSIVILFSLSSCNRYIAVQKTYDPEIMPGKKPCKILLVNIFDYTSPAYVKETDKNTYRTGVIKLAEGLSSSFAKDESFKFIVGDTLKKNIIPGQLTVILPKDSILAYCKRQEADMLLTLDSLNIFFDWETVINNEDKNNLLKEKNFYLHTKFYLSFYSATGDLINRSMIEENSLYKSRMALSGLITFKPPVSKAVGIVESLSFQAGQDYVTKFYPRTVMESRQLYTGKAFKECDLFIKLRNWDKVTELLDELAKSPDPDIAVKARHNLSVIKELAVSGN